MKTLKQAKTEALTKGWKALRGYKFVMFGYWAGVWVDLNKLDSKPEPNPFKELVDVAKWR